jgi:hypothetical protein
MYDFNKVAEILNAARPILRFVYQTEDTLRIDFWSASLSTLWIERFADDHFEYTAGRGYRIRCTTLNKAIVEGLAACEVFAPEQRIILRALGIGG